MIDPLTEMSVSFSPDVCSSVFDLLWDKSRLDPEEHVVESIVPVPCASSPKWLDISRPIALCLAISSFSVSELYAMHGEEDWTIALNAVCFLEDSGFVKWGEANRLVISDDGLEWLGIVDYK